MRYIGTLVCVLATSALSAGCATTAGSGSVAANGTHMTPNRGTGIEEYVFRSKPNKNVAPDCSGASFGESEGESKVIKFYGDLHAISGGDGDGRVLGTGSPKVGGMSVCLEIVDWYTPHKLQLGYYKVDFNGMSFEGEGKVAILSRDNPAPWVVHAYNAVEFSKLSPEYSAGSMVSSGIFDVKGKGGGLTGSLWILRLVKKSSSP